MQCIFKAFPTTGYFFSQHTRHASAVRMRNHGGFSFFAVGRGLGQGDLCNGPFGILTGTEKGI
jgi:hypothetical protein